MKSPVLDRRHIREYLLFGGSAAAAYLIALIIFLSTGKYQNLYYLFIGCILFMAIIFFYVYRLLFTRYDEKRAVSMLMAGHMATFAGIIISAVLSVIAVFIFNPEVFSASSTAQVLPNAASQDRSNAPGYLLMMILFTAILGNFATGSFISVIVSYAGKKDQTRDKPVDIPQKNKGYKM